MPHRHVKGQGPSQGQGWPKPLSMLWRAALFPPKVLLCFRGTVQLLTLLLGGGGVLCLLPVAPVDPPHWPHLLLENWMIKEMMDSKCHRFPKDGSLWEHFAVHFCQALWTPSLATKYLCQEGKGHKHFLSLEC